jgi:thymidylate kinase
MKKGHLIVFEGIDGAGLTTNSNFLVNWLKSKGYKAIYTKEPTESEIGIIIRKILKSNFNADPFLLTLLFTADRQIHVNNIILPAIKEGYFVVCDRYYFSTITYQSTHGMDERIIRKLSKNFPKPDIVFLLDIDPRISLKRKGEKSELYEKIDFLDSVRKKFLELASEMNFIVIPAEENLSYVQSQIIKVISYYLEEIEND